MALLTYHEVIEYVLKHPEYKIPDANEAEQIHDNEHSYFWTDEELGGRHLVYRKDIFAFVRQHSLIKAPVCLIRL